MKKLLALSLALLLVLSASLAVMAGDGANPDQDGTIYPSPEGWVPKTVR